jgi:hypothetical protein
MASQKRQRQRVNKEMKIEREQAMLEQRAQDEAKQAGLLEKRDRMFDALLSSFKPDRVQRAANAAVTGLFMYGIVAKTGVLPNLRNHIPEPFDIPDHIGNVYWTLVLGRSKFTGYKRAEKRFAEDSVDRIYNTSARNPALPFLAKSALIGVGLNTVLEGVSGVLPPIAQRITGGFDPLDVVYGVAGITIAAGWQAAKSHAFVAMAEQPPTQSLE